MSYVQRPFKKKANQSASRGRRRANPRRVSTTKPGNAPPRRNFVQVCLRHEGKHSHSLRLSFFFSSFLCFLNKVFELGGDDEPRRPGRVGDHPRGAGQAHREGGGPRETSCVRGKLKCSSPRSKTGFLYSVCCRSG